MELRKHPRMVWQCRPNWPPHWKGPYGPDRPLPTGEVGILQRVDPPSENVGYPTVFLISAGTVKTISPLCI